MQRRVAACAAPTGRCRVRCAHPTRATLVTDTDAAGWGGRVEGVEGRDTWRREGAGRANGRDAKQEGQRSGEGRRCGENCGEGKREGRRALDRGRGTAAQATADAGRGWVGK